MTTTSSEPKLSLSGNQPSLHDRASRYSGIVSVETLKETRALVVGVGAIGRQVALMLAAMGVGCVSLIDHDKVEPANMGAQGYKEDQIGMDKVQATWEDMTDIAPDCDSEPIPEKYSEGALMTCVATVVFCCVDDMAVRRQIMDDCVKHDLLFIEARMGAESCDIWRVADSDEAKAWAKAWYPQEDVFPAPCAARSTLYCANIAAGLMVYVWTGSIRDHPITSPVSLSLATLSCGAPPQEPPKA